MNLKLILSIVKISKLEKHRNEEEEEEEAEENDDDEDESDDMFIKNIDTSSFHPGMCDLNNLKFRM